MKTIEDIQTEIDNLIKRLSDIYDSLQYELRFQGYNRNYCYRRSLEDKLTFGEFRLDDLREELKKAMENQKGPFRAECFHTGQIIASSHSSKERDNLIKEKGYVKVDMADHWYRPTPQPRTIIVKEQ